LARALGSRIEAGAELSVLSLELAHLLCRELSTGRYAGRILELLDSRFSLQGATPETCELVSEVPDELMELVESLLFRTFAV
jgi:hypothetical protein